MEGLVDPPGPPAPPGGDEPPPDPLPDLSIRRDRVGQALLSREFRNGIEAMLHVQFRRRYPPRPFRWDELLAEVEEVANEAAVRALRPDRLATYDPTRPAWLWLLGIATNVISEYARWRDREERRSVGQSSLSEEGWQAILSSLSVEPRSIEEADKVWNVVARLTPEQQRVIRLRYVEDRPYSEIAELLRITEAAARMRVYRAIQALGDQLGPDANS